MNPKFDPHNPPPPLLTSEPDSFARKTITTRKPAILKQVLADHPDYPPPIVQALNDLFDEITTGRPIELLHSAAPDQPYWHAQLAAHRGKSWLNVPWYFAEAYFYRRLLEAAGYFGGSHPAVERWRGVDPFWPQKQRELAGSTPWQVLALALRHTADDSGDSFRALLHHAVWGNRVDLSYNKVAQESGRQIALEQERANLLADDTELVLARLQAARPAPRIDFICDNSGTELLLDLALADFLLRFEWANTVVLHVKFHPTFVSDATPADIEHTTAAVAQRPTAAIAALGRRLAQARQNRRLRIRDDIFWNSADFFWQFPPLLRDELAQAALVVIKGDANYRRLLGDSRWPADTPLHNAVPWFPAPFVALRTMKSDPVAGLQAGQAKQLDSEDPQWRVNGKRGVIQFVG